MDKNTIDSPVEKPQFKTGDAGSLPTKTYPSNTKMATSGKSNTIEGPCSEKCPDGVYHK